MKKRSKKGFTLAELLIVIAIIAILVAIMFPVFGAQLDKARAAADLANVRAAYSEEVANAMLGGTPNAEGKVDLTDPLDKVTIKKSALDNARQYPEKTVVGVDETNHKITVTYDSKYEGSFEYDEDVTITETSVTPAP